MTSLGTTPPSPPTSAVSSARKLLGALDERRAGELCKEALARAGVTVGGDAPWDDRAALPSVARIRGRVMVR